MRKINLLVLLVIISVTVLAGFGQNVLAFSLDSRLFSASADRSYGDYFLFAEDKTVSLDLEEVPLVAVVKMLSQQLGLNFISTEAVRDRRITVYLDEVPLKQAMDILFRANNLDYEYYPEAKMFVVKDLGDVTPEIETKIYQLKYARLGSSSMTDEMEYFLGDEIDIGDKFCIVDVITEILAGRGRVIGNSNTNTLVVMTSPSLMPTIDQIVASLDQPPVKVMIEVEVLEVSKDAVDNLGFRHSGGIHGSFTPFPGKQRSEITGDVTSFHPGNIGPFSQTAVFDFSDYNITAEFQKRDTTAKTLARPRLLTLNNETAQINVTTDEVIGTRRTEDDDRVTIEAERAGTGVRLRVTPQVNAATGEITLVIYPFVGDAIDSVFQDELGNVFKSIRERSTRSVVRLLDGETLLLGGLITKAESKTSAKVPFLEKIPLLGALFRHRNTEGGDRELMIFLTPQIVESGTSLAQRRAPSGVFRREQTNRMRQHSIRNTLDKYIAEQRNQGL